MPYTNLPKSKWAPMDRCVTDVMAKKKIAKKNAIAICYTSIVGKKELPEGAIPYPGRKSRPVVQPVVVREDGSVDWEATEAASPPAEEIPIEDVKSMDEPMEYQPFDGASTFSEYDVWKDAQIHLDAVYSLNRVYEILMRKALYSDDPDKLKTMDALTKEYGKRLQNPEEYYKETEEEKSAEPPAVNDNPTPPLSAFNVYPDGDVGRWVALVTNKYRDRDKSRFPKGEIIADIAHKEFMDWLDAHPEQAPKWWTWHTPVRESQADFWDYTDEGFVVMSGPMTKEEFLVYKDVSGLGVSHGFSGLVPFTDEGVLTRYRSFEISDLPQENAANPWAPDTVIRKEWAMGFSPKKRAYLVGKLGEAEVTRIESQLGQMSKALEALGVDWKDLTVPETPAPTTPPEPDKPADTPAPASTTPTPAPEPTFQQVNDELFKELMGRLNVPELQAGLVALKTEADKVPTLETRLKALEEVVGTLKKSQDDAVAAAISPKAAPPIAWFQPSKDPSTVLNKDVPADKALETAAPDSNWLRNSWGDPFGQNGQ